jgi:acetyltransferase-like isoleucine patch superfamily enzyme
MPIFCLSGGMGINSGGIPKIPALGQFLGECLEHLIVSSPSNRFFSRLRYYYFRSRLKGCAGTFDSMTGISLFCPQNITLGTCVSIGRDTIIDASDGGSISIGNNCLIGPFVLVRAADHRFDDPDVPILEQGHNPGIITIGDDCWIAGHVTITRNVTIGRGSVIGANSVVTKNIPPGSIAAGNPAVVLKTRSLGTDGQVK